MNRARNNGVQGNMNGNGMNGNGNLNRNGNMNGNNMNGGNMNGGNMNGRTGAPMGNLAEQVRQLDFVKRELELYLDTHPNCRTALDYYYQTVQALNRLTEEYHNTYGPLVAAGANDPEHWTWTDTPWPWQQAGDFAKEYDR